MATNPAVLKEAKRRVAAGEPLEDSHQKAWDKEQRRVAGQAARRKATSATAADSAADIVQKTNPTGAPLARQKSWAELSPDEVAHVAEQGKPFGKAAINTDISHHDRLRELADHISNRIADVETPANSIGVGRIASHLKNVYDNLDEHANAHKSGEIAKARTKISAAAGSLGTAEKEFQAHFPNEKLRPGATSTVPMGDVATQLAHAYVTSETPGVGSKPDAEFNGVEPTKRKYTTKADKAAKEEALPANVKRVRDLTPAQNEKNKAAFQAKNPKAEPTPATDRMLREANRAKLSAIADIKHAFPDAPDGAPEATYNHHLKKATEAIQAGQPIEKETRDFLKDKVISHLKRSIQKAKVTGGIKSDYTDSGAEMPNATVSQTDNEVKIPSSEEAAGEVTLRPGRGGRSGSMAEFANGRG